MIDPAFTVQPAPPGGAMTPEIARDLDLAPDRGLLGRATEFEFSRGAHSSDDVRIVRAPQRDGSVLWKVMRMGEVLTTDGSWEWEPQPSSRTDAYLARTRFATLRAAWLAAEREQGTR